MSILYGAGSCWVFLRTANMTAIRSTANRIQAHLYELLLFSAEPALVWRAQKALVLENVRFLLLMLPPVAILALPTVWLMFQCDTAYGLEPLALNEPALVTARIRGTPPAVSSLQTPPQIAVESPAVRVLSASEISWRIRPAGPVSGNLRFAFAGQSFTKSISAGTRTFFLSPFRNRSFFEHLLHPAESRLPPGDVISLEVPYPRNETWVAWFLLISTLAAVAAGRWLL
ncbi:MAG TPA: hypothetical protein VKU01_10475 [Bryobacteraceae bacterium]|nr:hypothetical protein [Bryobacteraceae bacterium]